MEELLIVAGIHLLGVASPGPDLALVLKNSLANGRQAGVYSALGIALGVMVHVIYCIAGLALVISKSVLLFNAIKLVGALYLLLLGFKALREAPNKDLVDTPQKTELNISNRKAFKQGLLTNIFNPKVTLFFLGLFTQVINTDTLTIVKLLYGIEMVTATFIWFSLVAIFMTQKPVQKIYKNIRVYIDKLFGLALIALGLKVASS